MRTSSFRMRRIVALTALVPLLGGIAAAADPLPPLPPLPVPICGDPVADPINCVPVEYRIEAAYRQPDGQIHRTRRDGARILIPEVIDVTGDLLPDLLIQLQIDAGRATVRSTRLPSAPSPMPLAIETILIDPRGSSPLRVAFGYDALEADAPGVYDATLGLLGAGRVTSFGLDVHVAEPGDSLAVTAAVFEEGDDGERIDPQSGRVTFTPVPVVARFDVLVGSDFGSDQSGINVVTDTPTTLQIQIGSIQGTREERAEITVDRLPNTVSITYGSLSTGQGSLNYSASDFIDVIDIRVSSYDDAVLKKDLTVHFEDMPLSATIVQDSAESTRAQASSPIGLVRVGIADDGVPVMLDEGAYVYATDRSGYDSLAFQLHDLSAAELGTGDPLVLGATLRSETLHVLVEDGPAQIEAYVRDMPGQFRIAASPATGTIEYTGSAVVGELTVDAHDPGGIAGDATDLHLLMRDIPRTLTLGFAPDDSTVTLDAGQSTLGLIEVQLTNGPNNRIDPAYDGIRFDDTAAGYEMFGRVTGLRRVVAQTVPAPRLDLQTTGGRIFVVRLSQQGSNKVEYTNATLDRLVERVQVEVAGDNILYTASAPTNSLVFDTNSGDRWNLRAGIADPVPASFSLCRASDISCTPAADRSGRGSAGSGSLRLVASEHTTVTVFDCVRPLSASCVPGSADEFTAANLRVRVLGEDANCNSTCEAGHIYLDTDNHSLTGSIENRDRSGGGFRAAFPTGFNAQNRLGKWNLWGFSKSKSGSISCPGGTGLDVRLIGIWFGVTSYLC